ncbi:MAG: FlgD immunoglobulin-like domain containing protein [Candidatus Cloacimonetes bacterium]|nr:FlgD immunoglobulin-like domain containing protein [Candidatus Cloacimonadota bacterium]MDD4814067.1 FlgD immunoglobulin-like domain containing protein [Candidatus Cloacimonadota bacterium]
MSLLVMFFVYANANAVILAVAPDGSQPFSEIQTAIDASAHGDTVLVYPGRYIENLRFHGKNITLASLELLSGDRDHIHSTIIDGNQNGSVLRVNENESIVQIRGFTITNGNGSLNNSGTSRYGGGVNLGNLSGSKQVSLINCIVTGNKADSGGGISGSGMTMHLSGVSIHSNTASSGGGIWFYGSSIDPYNTQFDPDNRCSIYSNYAAFGSDMYFYQVDEVNVVVDTFTVANPWNFYATAIPHNPNITNPYTFDILHTVHEEENRDFYVAPWGDDSNSGISPDQPMKSIFMAMYNIASDSENPKTVHVANGHYSPSVNGQLFPVPIKSHTNLVGESREGTIVDCEFASYGFLSPPGTCNWQMRELSFNNGRGGVGVSRAREFEISDITISNHDYYMVQGINANHNSGNALFENIKIDKLRSSESGKGFDNLAFSGELMIRNMEISDCEAPDWRAIYIQTYDETDLSIDGIELFNNRCTLSDEFSFNSIFQISPNSQHANRLRIDLRNSAFYNNYQSNASQMTNIRSLNDTLFISNCTFAGNTGGGVPLCVQGTSVLTNNILHNPDSVYQILVPNNTSSGIFSSLTLYYNNILGGYSGVISQSGQNPVWWLTGNSDVDPLFVGEGNRPYLLSPLSPLIDSGRQAASGIIEDSRDAAGNERYWDGDGDGISIIDLGAYEYQPIYQPIDLMAEATDRQIFLSWQMQAPQRGLSGFRIYRNGAAYADILDPAAHAFRDYSAEEDTLYYYLSALYGSVESASSNTVMVILNPSANTDEQALPGYNKISVSPNPFNELAVISYTLEKQSEVELKVYNLKGQLIKTLHKGSQNKGEQVLAWDGSDNRNQAVSAGLYFLRLSASGGILKTHKVLKL